MTKFDVADTHVYQTATGIYSNVVNEHLIWDIEKQKEKVRLETHEHYDMNKSS